MVAKKETFEAVKWASLSVVLRVEQRENGMVVWLVVKWATLPVVAKAASMDGFEECLLVVWLVCKKAD